MLTTLCHCCFAYTGEPHSHRPDLDCPREPMEPEVTARTTSKQPAMPELADWTDEVIDEASRDTLIAIIKANPDSFSYGVRKVVFMMELVGPIFGTGILGKMDALGGEFLKVMAKEGPEVKQSYGKLEFSIFEEEDTLRYQVRDRAKRARKDRDAEKVDA